MGHHRTATAALCVLLASLAVAHAEPAAAVADEACASGECHPEEAGCEPDPDEDAPPGTVSLLQTRTQLSRSGRGSSSARVANGDRNLVFMHMPFNFGHTIEKVAAFGTGAATMPTFHKLLRTYGDFSGQNSPTSGESTKVPGIAWGHISPLLQEVSNVTGCPLYYTPQKHWPKDLAEKYFGSGSKVFGVLRDPYERLVAGFRGDNPQYGASEAEFFATCDVVFSVLLSLWCMGAVAWTCDKHDINHMFILGVDPRCRVNPTFFFSRAAALTTVWILIFGMYVVDYKWRVLPTVWAKSGINKRASFHFVLYPIALLAATVLGMLWPSRICRNRYKGEVLRSVRRTAMAPFQPVDFADNIVGDILTSLAKPLQDVPAAVCYLLSPHPEPQSFVEKFALKGDNCSDDTHHCVLPVIAGLPYVFRALQCLRRFRDTRETRHLWNFGKYLSSLLVVVVSSVWWKNLEAIAVVSAVATVYAGAWDVALDWGLGRQELLGCCGRAAAKPRDPQSVDREPTLPNTPTSKPARAERPERHLAGRVYWLCSFIDLAARSTWVLTLMPITIVTGSITGRVVLVSIISSVEIIRRSMWAVIRIEYEQLANASGFRALLWVPSKLNAAADRRTTMAGLGGPANLAQPLLQH